MSKIEKVLICMVIILCIIIIKSLNHLTNVQKSIEDIETNLNQNKGAILDSVRFNKNSRSYYWTNKNTKQ